MHVVIDLVNGDEIIVSDSSKKEDRKNKNLKIQKDEKFVRKQVININGEIVSR